MSHPVAPRMRRTLVVALALLSATAVAPAPAAHATPATIRVREDFNGDGYADLAVAASSGSVSGKTGAGYVAVLYGSASGLGTRGRQVYSQASAGVPGSPEVNDHFGSRLDAADLDGDGFTDLVVTADSENWTQDGVDLEGSRTVLWGAPGGFVSGTALRAAGSDAYRESVSATGDFNGDGHQDLVRPDRVEYGPFGRDGSAASIQRIKVAGSYDPLYAAAAGDVDGDGISDLVVGVSAIAPDDEEYTPSHLNYLRGSRDGLLPPITLKDGKGRLLAPGTQVSLGDLNGDRRADLVVGGTSLHINYGTATGPGTTTTRVIDQDTPGVPGTQEEGDSFGSALSIGDVDGDGYGDVLAGNGQEAVGKQVWAGTFAVVPGGPKGPTGAGTKVFSQNTANVPGTAESVDQFGRGVHLVDGDSDGRAEPVVAAPGENHGVGAVWVFRTTSSGATAVGSFSFGPATLGMVANVGDSLGQFPI